MKFTLNSYRDCGRCSFGTLREWYDTEKEKILLKGIEVSIEKIEDLFPFLWQSPGCAYHNNDKGESVSNFGSVGTHWHHDYDKSIQECEKHIETIEKKIKKLEKSIDPRSAVRITKLRETQKWDREHADALRRICERCDAEMEEQKLKLIEENKK